MRGTRVLIHVKGGAGVCGMESPAAIARKRRAGAASVRLVGGRYRVRMMSLAGQQRRFRPVRGMSGLPLLATAERTCRHRHSGPEGDIRASCRLAALTRLLRQRVPATYPGL